MIFTRNSLLMIFLSSLALGLGACASIMHGTRQDVGISSAPTGATVTVDGEVKGKTPIIAKLTRKDNHFLKIELDGYKPYETTLTRGVSGWVWGNLAIGGLIGLAVDAISGGMYKLTPEQISASMMSGSANVSQPGSGIYVAVVLRAQPDWQRIGTLQRY